MATHTLGDAPEDPVCLVESCRRAIEWILIAHAAHGRLVARPWIDHPYGEEEITLLEEESDLRLEAEQEPLVHSLAIAALR